MFFGLYTYFSPIYVTPLAIFVYICIYTRYVSSHLPQCVVHGHNQEKYIQEGKIFCTYSHTMRPEGASNEAINTSSIEAIMKQQ